MLILFLSNLIDLFSIQLDYRILKQYVGREEIHVPIAVPSNGRSYHRGGTRKELKMDDVKKLKSKLVPIGIILILLGLFMPRQIANIAQPMDASTIRSILFMQGKDEK